MPKRKKGRKVLIFGAMAIVLVGLGLLAVFRKREAVISVQTEKVMRRTIVEIVSANGKIQPVVQVKISPEVSGEIIELPVKEGQCVQKGELIIKINPDFYIAARNQALATYKGSLAGKDNAEATLRKAAAEYKRNLDLFRAKLISDSAFDEVKANYDVAQAQVVSAEDQVEMSRASLTNAAVELSRTTIVSPLTGTITKLDSQVGERVVGTATMAGTEIMTLADLNEMEARVDIGESDVTLIHPGQRARLEVDAFKDRKFMGVVTDIADSANNNNPQVSSSSGNQEATKFEVKIRIKEKEAFRPGMSVTAEIETRGRTNVLAVPFASVTMRQPKNETNKPVVLAAADPPAGAPVGNTNRSVAATNNPAGATNHSASVVATNRLDQKSKEATKPVEVVFIVDHGRAKMVRVKPGIYDDSYYEITDGLKEGEEVISGGFRAISKELEDGKKIRVAPAVPGESLDQNKDNPGP